MYMCICVKIWLNCFSYYYHHATTIMVNKDYYKSKQLIQIPDDMNSHRRSHDSALETRRPASADRTVRRQFQATGQPVSRTQASDAMTSRLPRHEAKSVQRRCFQWGSVPLDSDIKGMELPPVNILIPLERQLIALQLCCWQFLYNDDFCIG